MLDINQIETFYPENLRPFKKNMLREYLQYKILEILYRSELGRGLVFMGGTAIRIVHANTRFSEDLDFDNRGLDKEQFEQLARLMEKELALEGYKVGTECVTKGAFRCYIKIYDLLYQTGISAHRTEKLLIQLDTEPQGFEYRPQQMILNKFDVFTRINVVPVDILLSQKICCIFTRKRPMGRDFYDIVFLMGKTAANLDYLDEKLHLKDAKELRDRLLKRCEAVDFKNLADDVMSFVPNPKDAEKVLYFPDFIRQIMLAG